MPCFPEWVRRLILIFHCLAASQARAAVVPEFDATRETILVDKRGASPAEQRLPTGLWHAEQDGYLQDGTVRVRLKIPKGSTRAVVIAVRTVEEANGVRAYGLSLEGRFCRLVAMQSGVPESIQNRVMIARSSRPGMIEVVLSVFSDAMVANIFDPQTGKLLATTSVTGLAIRPGRVAISSEVETGPALHLLSTRRACAKLPLRPVNGTDDELPVVVTVAQKDWSETRAYAELLETTGDGLAVLRTEPVGLEHLFCSGVTLHSVQSELPWKYIDLSYLKARNQPPVVTTTGYDLDRSYKNAAMVEGLLRGWHSRYPKRTRVEVLGRSHQGRPILAFAIGENLHDGDVRPSVLLAGAHHGDELMGTEMVLDAIRVLVEGQSTEVKRWRESVVVYAVPMVNPDGVQVFLEESPRAGRKNGRDNDGDGTRGIFEGVDLNRNYPFRWERPSRTCSDANHPHYRGSQPASEPETRAMMSLAERERFVASLSYHMGNLALLVPYTTGDAEDPVPNEAWLVAEGLIRDLSHPQGQMKVRHSIYAVQGTDQDWLRHEHGTVAILVEGALWPPPKGQAQRRGLIDATRPIWQRLLDRIINGPTLTATVVDSSGHPLKMNVNLAEVELRASESWTTRPRDGSFVRILPYPGEYTVRIDGPGVSPVVERVTVDGGRVDVKIVMSRL